MIEYRKIQHEDYNDILEISKYTWSGGDYLPAVFHKWVDDGGYFMGAVDTATNRVIGTGKFSILHDGTGWMEGLRVHKDFRGQKISREISRKLLDIALEYRQEGIINKISFATHGSSIESITLMEKLGFKLKYEQLVISRSYESAAGSIYGFKEQQWEISCKDFLSHDYFKKRKNFVPLAYIFQQPTPSLYQELKDYEAFVMINGYTGIFKLKGEPSFICMDDNYEGIDTFFNYYLLKLGERGLPEIYTIVNPDDKALIDKLKQSGYESWNDWKADYLYFVYER